MHSFVENALIAIESADDSERREGFLALAEVVAANRIKGFASDIYPEANSVRMDAADFTAAQNAIIGWLEQHPDDSEATSAFYVLDKFRDRRLVPVFRDWLQRYVARIEPNVRPLGQILVCLSDVGEKAIFGTSFSADEFEQNLKDALAYLRGVQKR